MERRGGGGEEEVERRGGGGEEENVERVGCGKRRMWKEEDVERGG